MSTMMEEKQKGKVSGAEKMRGNVAGDATKEVTGIYPRGLSWAWVKFWD